MLPLTEERGKAGSRDSAQCVASFKLRYYDWWQEA